MIEFRALKTIGLLGGMSWESTDLYYQSINKIIQSKLGKLHSAKIILISVDFAEIEKLQHKGEWDEAGVYLKDQAVLLEKAGADGILLCTNTMHKVSAQIENALSIPFIHIADATASKILDQKLQKIGLLGTAFTMEQDFYTSRLEAQGIQVIIPQETSRKVIHEVIYDELCLGIINEASRAKYINIVQELIDAGAEGIILGCTEICMLIGETEFSVPIFDTTAIHAEAAVAFALT